MRWDRVGADMHRQIFFRSVRDGRPRMKGHIPSHRCLMLLPVVPLRDIVLFPGVTMPLYVGRPRTLAALAAAGAGPVVFVDQRQGAGEAPGAADLYAVGTIGVVLQQAKVSEGNWKLLVRGD